jgi:HSP20 family protein
MSEAIAVNGRNGAKAASRARAHAEAAPPVDVLENADELLVVTDIPGVEPSSVEVWVENDMLALEAKPADAVEDSPALAREFEDKRYSRRFRIPAGVDGSSIKAEAKNGTLIVRLPKAAAAKPRKVEVHRG